MDEAEKLYQLRAILDEDEGGVLSDEQLLLILEKADGDLSQAAYLGAVHKAHCDALATADGLKLDSDRSYWLGLAAAYRPNRGGRMWRAGEGRNVR